jgi:cytochrome c oxidase assembly factor CtaG/cytochrome c2
MLLLRRLAAAAALTLAAAPAFAAEARDTAWSFEPWVVANLALAAIWYAAGVVRLHRRLDPNRENRPLAGGHIAAFAAGIATLFVVLVSPIDSIADQLFWVHMVQHLALLLIAAPLLVLGRPVIAFLWAFGPQGRKLVGRTWTALGLRRTVNALMHPILVWLLFCGAFVVWHFPGPYQWALANEGVHTLEHLSFFVTALMFWSIVIEPSGRRRLNYGPTLVFIITAAILSGLPGALIALAPRPLYPAHAAGDAAWGLSPLADQQLAGIVMWIPGGLVYLTAVGFVFLKWLQQGEGRPAPLLRRALLPALVAVIAPLLLGGCDDNHGGKSVAGIGNFERGIGLIRSYGCGGCHTVPGIADATGVVGPPLTQMSRRIYIAGLLRNTPENMVTWLRDPQRIVPGNAMPDMNLSDRDAHDVAAYLYTLR